jgi:hypothetical protein
MPVVSSDFVAGPAIAIAADKKRAAPYPINPIALDGVRYEAIQFGKPAA